MPEQLRCRALLTRATVAIEDRRFWQHGGIDFQGILRAGVDDVLGGGRNIQGGSTLTMQLVRNIYLPDKLADTRAIKRKIVEAKLAEELESKRTKRWILTEYLNDVDYGTVGGQTAVGVGAASQLFFDKPVWKLDIAQAALLAGPPAGALGVQPVPRPRARPRPAPRGADRDGQVRTTSRQAQANRADRSTLQVKPNDTYSKVVEPYIFDYVRQALIQRFGVADGRRRAGSRSTRRSTRSSQAEARAGDPRPRGPAGGIRRPRSSRSIRPTATSWRSRRRRGTARAGRRLQLRLAGSHRQTGSAFKVFVLMTLIHDYNGDPNKTYYNSHLLLPGWLPGYPTYSVQTAEHSYQGNISVTKATTTRTTPCSRSSRRISGLEKVTATAHAMGITSPLTNFPSEVLGAGCRLTAGDGRRVRDDRQRRHPPSRHGDHQGRVPGRQRRQSRRLKGHPRVQPRRGICGHPGD